MKVGSEKEKWILLILLTIIWGSSFILIKKSLDYFAPYQVGSLRVLIAGIILFPLAIKNKKAFRKKDIKYLIIAAACGNFIPMFLFPLAETEVSSSIAGIINSMVPIFVIILGSFFWNTKTTKMQIFGTIISFLGVCILAFDHQSGDQTKFWPLLLLLMATVFYAINGLTVKTSLSHIGPRALSSVVFGYVLLLPSIISLILSGFFQDTQESGLSLEGLLYVGLLSIIGTGLAMMLNYRLLSVSSALFTSIVTLLMPIVAVIWGVLDGEQVSMGQVLGGVIIILGLLFLRSEKKNTSHKER